VSPKTENLRTNYRKGTLCIVYIRGKEEDEVIKFVELYDKLL